MISLPMQDKKDLGRGKGKNKSSNDGRKTRIGYHSVTESPPEMKDGDDFDLDSDDDDFIAYMATRKGDNADADMPGLIDPEPDIVSVSGASQTSRISQMSNPHCLMALSPEKAAIVGTRDRTGLMLVDPWTDPDVWGVPDTGCNSSCISEEYRKVCN